MRVTLSDDYLEGTSERVMGIYRNRAFGGASPIARSLKLPSSQVRENRYSSEFRPGSFYPVNLEEPPADTRAGRNQLSQKISEFEKATPAHQTWGDLLLKDLLIVTSIAFWPAVIYLLM